MDIDIKIYIKDVRGKPFFGKGPSTLIEKIKETGSIRQAAKKMNMSYSKAHKMVKKMEKEIGGKLLKKQAGGSGGGGTGLTRRAGKLIEDYENMEKDIKKFAQKRFKKFKNQ